MVQRFFVDTVGQNKKMITKYIQNQLKGDEVMDQIMLKEYVDPFTGSENSKAKKQTALAAACDSNAVLSFQCPFRGKACILPS